MIYIHTSRISFFEMSTSFFFQPNKIFFSIDQTSPLHRDQKSRSFCIESLLKSETTNKLADSAAIRLPPPPLTPPSTGASPPPPPISALQMPLPQLPFPPQLLPYLLPAQHQGGGGGGGPSTPADYVHMEYLARQGVFLNSFPGFAGNCIKNYI